jgi:hypothetical protein
MSVPPPISETAADESAVELPRYVRRFTERLADALGHAAKLGIVVLGDLRAEHDPDDDDGLPPTRPQYRPDADNQPAAFEIVLSEMN